jgi:putative tryptophan/tyrosine transport system substrate-binding protein
MWQSNIAGPTINSIGCRGWPPNCSPPGRRHFAPSAIGVSTAKAATRTLPTLFLVSEDPVRLGLVTSLARPGGNLTGVNLLSGELAAKRLELLHEMLPTATRVAVLVNPTNPSTESTLRDIEPAARTFGVQIRVLNASTIGEINAAFESVSQERPDAVFVSIDIFLASRRVQLANLASHHTVPTSFSFRDCVEAGGLMSYGSDIADAFRQLGAYAGRILKGTKPTELPVVQSSKFELVINTQTARMLGLTVPPLLLTIADEVIE